MIFLIGGDLDFYDYPLDPKELEKERIHSRIKMDAVKHPKAPPSQPNCVYVILNQFSLSDDWIAGLKT